MERGIHTVGPGGIINLTESFSLDIELIPVEDYKTAFQIIDNGTADAAVVNRLFGDSTAHLYNNIKKTNIIFNPIGIHYALTSDNPASMEISADIDKYLRELKEDNNSIYYKAIDEYLAGFVSEKTIVPDWLFYSLTIGTRFLIIFTILLYR